MALSAKDLRIGNYLFMPFTSENVKVTGLALKEEKTQVMYIQSKFGTSQYFALPEQYSPIELTEELLLKIGFNEEGKIDNENYVFDVYFYDCWRIDFREKLGYGDTDINLTGYWKLHELQNLYFALTGSELVFSTEP